MSPLLPNPVDAYGSFALTTRNLEKLAVIDGSGPITLPTSKSLEPFETCSATFECEGTEASDSEGDTGDLQTRYDTFGGQSEVDCSAIRTYTCPIASTYTPDVTVFYRSVTHSPSMMVVEPQLVVTRSATATGWFWPGQVGMGCLRTENYIGPMHVSFQGVKVAEIPCESVIPPEGWFASTNYTGSLSHDYYAGAGPLHPITDGNYWMADEAGRDVPYGNWFAGRMTWKIPIGWKRILSDGDDFTHMKNPDFEQWGVASSRPLLIGGSEDSYLQIFKIDENGTASVEKFGHRLSRARTSFQGVVIPQQ